MKITFYGATREVTGSCYLLETAKTRVLIDCGLFQGTSLSDEKNLTDFPFDPKTIDAIFLTHGHLDHVGRLPKIVHDGFSGPIITTGPTAAFARLILEDSVSILTQEAKRERRKPIFSEEDFQKTVPLFQETSYHKKIAIGDMIVEFFDAGHILGSASIRVTGDNKRIVFSGDLGNPPVPILQPTEMIDEAEYAVMESTYGSRIHEDKTRRSELLKKAIFDTVSRKGVLMIPAFAIERTQEVLYELNQMVESKEIPPVSIFLDSPLAIHATRVFRKFQEYFNPTTQEIIFDGDDIFHFQGLHLTLQSKESREIKKHPAPKVIIAGSGMAQGGRIVHHIEEYISDPRNTYLIIGYQVAGSLGRRLLDGEKKIRVNGKLLHVRAHIQAIGGYSAHADQDALTRWISHIDQGKKLQTVFLTHGEEDQAILLQNHLEKKISADIIVPTKEQTIEL